MGQAVWGLIAMAMNGTSYSEWMNNNPDIVNKANASMGGGGGGPPALGATGQPNSTPDGTPGPVATPGMQPTQGAANGGINTPADWRTATPASGQAPEGAQPAQPQTWQDRQVVAPTGQASGPQGGGGPEEKKSTGMKTSLSRMKNISEMVGSDAPDSSGRRATGLSAKTIMKKAVRIISAIYTGGASEVGVQGMGQDQGGGGGE